MKKETPEEVRKVERTELFNSIFSVVKKIPRKDIDVDAMDAPSCAYEIEQLFYEWQQEQDKYNDEELSIITSIRNYFRENNETSFENFAYNFLDKIIKHNK